MKKSLTKLRAQIASAVKAVPARWAPLKQAVRAAARNAVMRIVNLGRNGMLALSAFLSFASIGMAFNATSQAFAVGKEARACQLSLRAGGTCTEQGHKAMAVQNGTLTEMFKAMGVLTLGCAAMGAYTASPRRKATPAAPKA